MSTQTNTYAIIGAVLPYALVGGENYDKFEPYFDSAFEGIHHHDGLCILGDGMGGEYAIVGKVLAKSDKFGLLFKPVIFDPIPNDEILALKQKIETLFPGQSIEVRAIALTHFR